MAERLCADSHGFAPGCHQHGMALATTTLASRWRACCAGTRVSGDDSGSLYRMGASRLDRSHGTGLLDPTPGARRSTCRAQSFARDWECGRELGREILES